VTDRSGPGSSTGPERSGFSSTLVQAVDDLVGPLLGGLRELLVLLLARRDLRVLVDLLGRAGGRGLVGEPSRVGRGDGLLGELPAGRRLGEVDVADDLRVVLVRRTVLVEREHGHAVVVALGGYGGVGRLVLCHVRSPF